jgi:hypothetical protein
MGGFKVVKRVAAYRPGDGWWSVSSTSALVSVSSRTAFSLWYAMMSSKYQKVDREAMVDAQSFVKVQFMDDRSINALLHPQYEMVR